MSPGRLSREYECRETHLHVGQVGLVVVRIRRIHQLTEDNLVYNYCTWSSHNISMPTLWHLPSMAYHLVPQSKESIGIPCSDIGRICSRVRGLIPVPARWEGTQKYVGVQAQATRYVGRHCFEMLKWKVFPNHVTNSLWYYDSLKFWPIARWKSGSNQRKTTALSLQQCL